MIQPSLFLTPFPRRGFAIRALPWHPARNLIGSLTTCSTMEPLTAAAPSHLGNGSPRLPRPTFPSFRLQPRRAPRLRFAPLTAYRATSGLRQGIAGSPLHYAESSSSSYGPTVRLRLLSTPPRGNAVTFGYGAVAHSDTDLHRADLAPSRAHDSGFRQNDEAV